MRRLKTILISTLLLGGLVALSMLPASTQAPGTTQPAAQDPSALRGPFENIGVTTPSLDGIFPGAPTGRVVNPDKEEVSISFAKADVTSVLTFLSVASGVPIVVDPEFKGTVTILGLKKVPLSLAYEVINSALRVRGYTMVGTLKDKVIRVVPLKRAVAEHAEVRIGIPAVGSGTDDAVVTQVIPVQHVSATKLRDELKPLVADDQANLIAVSESNTLIVTDTEGNIRRLMQIISLMDKDTTDLIDVDTYQCKYANAKALTTSLEKIFNVTKATQQQQPGQPQGGGRGGQPPNGNPNGGGGGLDDSGILSLKGELHIASDDRTNTLIISGVRQKINLVLQLAQKLDVDTTPEVNVRLFSLKYADAKQVASQLNGLFEQPQGGASAGGFRSMFFGGSTSTVQDDYASLKQNVVVADMRTNSVIVTATEQNMRTFESMIKQLDSPTELSSVTRAFPLKYASATTIANTLTSLFRGGGRSGFSFFDLISGNSTTGDPISSLRNITVVAEEKSNTLLITGPPQTFSMVQNIIENLDRQTTQVFIEVAIVDVTLDEETKFGLEWQWNSDSLVPGTNIPKSTIGTDFGLANERTGLRYSIISDNLQVLLHALSTRSNVKVYSTPAITTADNVQAKISIGSEQPFVSSETETTGGNLKRTVDYKNVAISLIVTPHVNGRTDLVSLDVQQTINELLGRELELNAPIIASREAITTVMVNSGQTIVIGGIIKENKERVTNAVPILSKIPILGEAFKSRTWRTQNSELMVFLTPHILRDPESVQQLTDAVTAGNRETMPSLAPDFKLLPASTDPPADPAAPVTPAAPADPVAIPVDDTKAAK